MLPQLLFIIGIKKTFISKLFKVIETKIIAEIFMNLPVINDNSQSSSTAFVAGRTYFLATNPCITVFISPADSGGSPNLKKVRK